MKGSDEDIVQKRVIPGLPNDNAFGIFRFFSLTELQKLKAVNRNWQQFMTYMQLRELDEELEWAVSSGLLSENEAIRMQVLLDMSKEQGPQYLSRWLSQ